MRMAVSRFLSCERSFWQATTMPVGRCVMRTAESAVFTPCPPGPEERYTSMRSSSSFTTTSTSSHLVRLGGGDPRGGRGVTTLGGVEGGDADQAVHADLALEIAVRVLAGDLDGGGLDARFLAREQIDD